MFNQKIYEANDKMISLISDNYGLLESLGRFGINLGFGDKTVSEVCREQGVDSYTFLAVVNFSINGFRSSEGIERMSVPTLLHYLKASHEYYLDFQLPRIRQDLREALDDNDNLARLIMKLYDSYDHEIRQHMKFEEQNVFPYVEGLLRGEASSDFDIQTFSKHHGQTTKKLHELKDIIIKYLPSDTERNNRLTSTLYDLYKNEEWLGMHAQIEDHIFIPAIQLLERQLNQNDVSVKISKMISQNPDSSEALSDREKDVIVALVQGMTNKEIADHLFISTNTVITHRRNIARKLQIHSPAGLTIYAIVNNLVDISSVKL
ncbi:MAG: hemerythrin domain-containing protein [Prevotella sp.]|nr:hemerythrin domain-containing protein [Prevotella sp.]MBQ8701188.1 hemerythrin domain-containing protein [Prevotella sp.]MBQ8702704.1 hemerythrin domain-containing protein [Prevotella sp.]MBQ9651528.1 hemerythrin domain-containing protein [Prevotella sp.]